MATGTPSRTAFRAALQRSSVALAAAALVACGGGGSSSPDAGAPPTTLNAAGGAPANASAGTPAASGTTASGAATAGTSSATPAVFQRPDFQVNTTSTGSQSGAVVAHLATGGYVAVWDSRAAEFGLSEVRLQRFDAQGQPLGTEQLVAPQGNDAQVAAFADGRFLVTWRLSPYANEVDARGAMFDAQGVQVGATLQLGTGFNSYQPRPLALPDGTFVLAIDTDDGKYSAPLGLVRRFAADGTPLGPATRLESHLTAQTGAYSPNAAGQARMALLADGRIATAWVASGTGVGELRLSLFDGQAQPLGAATVLDTRDVPVALPSIAALPDGGYAIAWATGAYGQPQAAFLEMFAADGTSRGRTRLASSVAGESGQITPRVALLADGSLAVAWSSQWSDSAQMHRALWMQRFDGTGAPTGPAQPVDSQLWTPDNLPADSLDLTATGGTGLLLLFGRWTAQDGWEVRAKAQPS